MDFLENYNQTHQNPINRLFHIFGIPLIIISLPLFFWNWRWALALFVLGWVFQFVGHVFEGKPPAFFSNPAYLITGVLWWGKKIFGFISKDQLPPSSKNH